MGTAVYSEFIPHSRDITLSVWSYTLIPHRFVAGVKFAGRHRCFMFSEDDDASVLATRRRARRGLFASYSAGSAPAASSTCTSTRTTFAQRDRARAACA